MAILQTQNLSFTYAGNEKQAVCDISIRVEEGEFIVLMGQSGCGKSTLLRLMKKQLVPKGIATGEVYYRDKKIKDLSDRTAASEIGFVMQDCDSQIVTDKVWHELAFGLESLGENDALIRRRIAEVANFFGLQNWYYHNTSDLSGGQKQLLSLASIMAMRPNVLLLDEPTAQLDPIAAAELIAALKKINRELGITIVIAEHRLEELFSVADRVLVLEHGKVLLFDEPKKLSQPLQSHLLQAALPTPMRVHQMLRHQEECPLTVREGKEFLTNHYVAQKTDRVLDDSVEQQGGEAIAVQHVFFRYDSKANDVLNDFNLTVMEKECLCMLGANGAGKTTALKVMSKLLQPYRGKVRLFGQNLQQIKEKQLYQNNVAYLPQNPTVVFAKDTVHEDLLEVLKLLNVPEEQKKQLWEQTISSLELSDVLNSHPYDLSGGQQQRAALGKLLLLQPKILLLDEPTKGIDAFAKLQLQSILKQQQQTGKTIVIVTHDVEFAACAADRCAMFFDGKIVSCGSPVAFFSDNSYYTTAASRMARHLFPHAVTVEQVVRACEKNQEKSHV